MVASSGGGGCWETIRGKMGIAGAEATCGGAAAADKDGPPGGAAGVALVTDGDAPGNPLAGTCSFLFTFVDLLPEAVDLFTCGGLGDRERERDRDCFLFFCL